MSSRAAPSVMEPSPRRLPRLRRSAPTSAVPAVNHPDAFLLPAPELPGGWQLRRRSDLPGSSPAEFASLEAAALALGEEEEFVCGLPLDIGLVTRFTLPEAPKEELEAMLRIQLEKVLPYAEDDLGLDYATVGRRPATPGEGTDELVVAAYAVHRERLFALCRPLTELARWPRQVTFEALLRASAAAGEGETNGPMLLAYREGGETVFAVCEGGRVVFAQTLPGAVTPETLVEDLPPVLLGAELEGVPTDFSRLALADDLPPAWREAIQRAVDPAGTLRTVLAPVLPLPGGESALADLSPAAWQTVRTRRAQIIRRRRHLLLAGAVYLVLLVLAFADLARLRYVRRRLDKRINAAAAPLAESDAARKRWLTLSPATDYRQSVVEILDQVRQCLPPGDTDLRITLLDLNRSRTPGVLTLEGEAPSYQGAIDLGEKLRGRGELREFRLVPEQPVILPNGRARFRVGGRLP